MSRIALTPNAAGTAIFTVASPATSTDRTLTLPDATTTLVGTDATQTLTNKSIAATQLTGDVAAARITSALNATGSAPIYACRAWVNFNGTGTVAIRASGNVTSITDNGVGNYVVNFTTAMQDTAYSTVAAGDGPVNGAHCLVFVACGSVNSTYSTTQVAVAFFTQGSSGTRADPTIASLSMFR